VFNAAKLQGHEPQASSVKEGKAQRLGSSSRLFSREAISVLYCISSRKKVEW